MQTGPECFSRRTFVRLCFGAGGLFIAHLPLLVPRAIALGPSTPPAGMVVVKGDVRINGQAAQTGSVVRPEDTITTGADAMAIFLIDRDVYLVRDNTRLELGSQSEEAMKLNIADLLRIVNGKVLAVFGKGPKRLEMPTVVAGIRGSGVYVEAEPQRTYICTCYGIADITPRADPSEQQTVKTIHHEAPRFVYASLAVSPKSRLIARAPVFNHTDAELIRLESFVYRKPPFVSRRGDGGY